MFSGRRFIGASKGERDIYWSNTKLLIHADGANGSTTITDSTGINSISVAGNAQISTAQYKYGTASLSLDGAGDYITAPSIPAFGTGDWTIETFIRLTDTTNFRTFYSTNGATKYLYFFVYNGKFYMSTGSNNITSTNTFSTNTWYHAALCKASGSTRLFINGVQEGLTYTDTNDYTARPGGVLIGTETGANNYVSGYLDEYRITVGSARYTANFTPPVAAFPNG